MLAAERVLRISPLLGLLVVLGLPTLARGAQEIPAKVDPAAGPPKGEFHCHRVQHDMGELVGELVGKISGSRANRQGDKPPHLVLLLDTSTSACRVLTELDKAIGGLFKSGPKGLMVSVVALRTQASVVAPLCLEVKELRRAIRQVIEESKNSQIRAKLQLNPGQRHQIQAWDTMVFITPDDCVKDWSSGVRFCLKEFGKDYPVDALALLTLDNPDTENNLEGLVSELTEAKVTFIACAPETLLTTSDPMPPHKRQKFYEVCKTALKIDYGADFFFHRRESAVNEVIPVDGLNGPVECVGNPTSYGFYGLARLAYATKGAYYIIADFLHPQCACMFHGPGDRLSHVLRADEPIRPGPLPGFKGKDKAHLPIKPYEFDPEKMRRCEPCVLSREEVFQIYAASPYYQYLNSLWDGGHHNWDYYQGNHQNQQWSRGEGEYLYGAYHISPWMGGAAPGKAAAGMPKGVAQTSQELEPLRIYTDYRFPPGAWRHGHQGLWGGVNGHYAAFYTATAVEAVRKYLDGVIKPLEERIETVRKGIPKDEPTHWDHRAISEIEYFILCLENQLFYLKQYRYFLDEMVKEPGVVALFAENKNDEEVRKALEEARKQQQANQQGGVGVSYIEIRMPRLLKQRCEVFAEAMDKRGPIFGGADGQMGLQRFLRAKEATSKKIGAVTWTNFFDYGWQRQYHWVRINPSWSGPGTTPPPRMPVAPVPPSYEGPPTASNPGY